MLGPFVMVATSGAASYQLVCGQQRTITEALRVERWPHVLIILRTELAVMEAAVQPDGPLA